MRYFDDVVVGENIALGTHEFTAPSIIAFAQRFDPQPFHLSEEGGRNSLFGGLCASGWQTASIWMKLWVAHVQHEAAAGGPKDSVGPSPGFQNLKWLKPVFVGDRISYTSRVTDKRPLASRPNWGLVSGLGQGFSQRDELVFAFTYHVFVRHGPAGPGGGR